MSPASMPPAPPGRLPAWLVALPLLPASADPALALAVGATVLALLAVARPALARLADRRAPGTRWAARLVVLATLAAALARLLEAAWPTLPPMPGGPAPALLAAGLLATADGRATASTAAARLALDGLADGTRMALVLLALAGLRAALGPAGAHAGTALAGVALLAALAAMAARRRGSPWPRRSASTRASTPAIPPATPPSPPPGTSP